MIKIEFPDHRTDIALAIGQALVAIAQGTALSNSPAPTTAPATAAAQFDKAVTAGVVLEEDDGEQEDDANGAEPATGEVDQMGVPFNKKFCAKAAEPFYKSGKYSGQWKKRKGVEQSDYDTWHDAECAKLIDALPQRLTNAGPDAANTADEAFDVGSTWSAPAAKTAGRAAPQNGGEFFAWVAEMQAAKHLTQADIDAAYPALNLSPNALWAADPATQAQMVGALYNNLVAKVPA